MTVGKRTAALAACALALAVLPGCGEKDEPELAGGAAEPEFEITGRWQGELTQQGVKPFTVTATIASLERSKDNVVRYSGIDCAGNWEYLGAGETAYRFREVIDRGEGGQCKGSGTVELVPLGPSSVDYRFSGGGVTSSGELRRAGG